MITRRQCEQRSEDIRLAILNVVVQQAERIATESPVRKVFEAISTLLARKRVYLAPSRKAEFMIPEHAELVGWFNPRDPSLVMLETNTLIAQAKKFWAELGENLDIAPDAFLIQTKQIAGLIQPGKDRVEDSIYAAGKSRRVLVVNRQKVMDLYGVDLSNEPTTLPDLD
jgi:hypothetical protein